MRGIVARPNTRRRETNAPPTPVHPRRSRRECQDAGCVRVWARGVCGVAAARDACVGGEAARLRSFGRFLRRPRRRCKLRRSAARPLAQETLSEAAKEPNAAERCGRVGGGRASVESNRSSIDPTNHSISHQPLLELKRRPTISSSFALLLSRAQPKKQRRRKGGKVFSSSSSSRRAFFALLFCSLLQNGAKQKTVLLVTQFFKKMAQFQGV